MARDGLEEPWRLRGQKFIIASPGILWSGGGLQEAENVDFTVGEPIHRTLLRLVQSCIRGCLARSTLSAMVLQADQRCNSVSRHLNPALEDYKFHEILLMYFDKSNKL